MKNLQEATERICELKGSLVALDALVPAVLEALSAPTRARLIAAFDAHAEAARTVMLHADISDLVLAAFERDIARHRASLQQGQERQERQHAGEAAGAVDALLMSTTQVATFASQQDLTPATGFFYRAAGRLFLVTSRHVLVNPDSAHFPDRIEFGLHTDTHDLTRHTTVSLPLYRDGLPQWREATDTGGTVDVAVIEIPAERLPHEAVLQCFDPSHLERRGEDVATGDALTIAGFPLDFHDTAHHLAVARSATLASAYGVRFQRQGCFLTDARTHRGSSGSPVVRRRTHDSATGTSRAWQLLGVHSTRTEFGLRDSTTEESPGLNRAWYADVLVALTAEPA